MPLLLSLITKKDSFSTQSFALIFSTDVLDPGGAGGEHDGAGSWNWQKQHHSTIRSGSGIARLLETNKRIRSLTTLGAPLGPIARGMLLNQSLHSLYVIRSKGQFEDLQLMGQALGFTRTLLVFWMGGSDDFLLGPLQAGAGAGVYQDMDDGGADGGADAHTTAAAAAAAQELYYSQQELQHLQMQQQQMLQRKILANRKLVRERGRVGWEELKLLGVDDDIIREVCQDI
ncbi:hypothetical protein B0O80DRAFT_495653 [Mortierella sp. GBAus27b]|nr:hypothetical protein B0O80DRAFT_495653 [Mortierella sp. GBAus27b]